MGQLVRGAPGVYVRGLATDPVLPLSAVTGFVGIASRGPLHVPQPIRSWDEFLIVFGGFVDYSALPHEVFGFFRNGGQRCYVVRVADPTDYSAENTANACPRVDPLNAAANTTAILDVKGAETIKIAAINEGRWGNELTYEFRAGSQQHMALTTLTAPAAAGATTLNVAEPFDLADGMAVRLAPPADPFGGVVVSLGALNAVSSTSDTVTLAAALPVPLPKGTVVVGQGFKLTVRLRDRTEVFDNLSMSPSNVRYFAAIVNGMDESLGYVDRQALGHSILVRVVHVFDGGAPPRSRLRPALQPSAACGGGGDGFRYASATLKDGAGARSIRVSARALAARESFVSARGTLLRIKAEPAEMTVALAAKAGDQQVVLNDVTGLTAGDAVTLKTPGGGTTETRPITGVDPAHNIVVLNTGPGGLTNAFAVDSTATVANRFTLSVFEDPIRPLVTTTAAGAAAAATQVVVDNVTGIRAQ